jgi:hypothetical protein
MDSAGKLVMESILETKAATILQFFAGLRATLWVTFEEGTCAACYRQLATNVEAYLLSVSRDSWFSDPWSRDIFPLSAPCNGQVGRSADPSIVAFLFTMWWRHRGWRWTAEAALFAGIALCGIYFAVIIIPSAPSGRLKEFALENNGDLREEIGSENLVSAVANIRDGFTTQQKRNLGVVVGNYGEGGAITILGPEHHLSPAIQLTNPRWLRGYPVPPPDTVIVVGWTQEQLEEAFTECRVAGHNGTSLGVKNEASADHPDIYVCDPPKQDWQSSGERIRGLSEAGLRFLFTSPAVGGPLFTVTSAKQRQRTLLRRREYLGPAVRPRRSRHTAAREFYR